MSVPSKGPRSQPSWLDRETIDLAQLFPPLGRFCPHPPSPKQAAFLLLDCREAFYGGAAGGGKSDALLAGALQYVDVPGYAALILRRTFAELEGADGLLARGHEWLAPHREDGVRWNEQKHRWTFPTRSYTKMGSNAEADALLEFGHVQEEKDKHKYQSKAYQYLGFDELTSFTETQYEYIGFTRSRRRKQGLISQVPIRVRSASNPGNVGHGWVKRRFITSPNPGVIFVPAKVADNPGLDVTDYVEHSLSTIGEVLRQQLLDGDWGVFEGMAFGDFDEQTHCYGGIALPDSFDRFEAMDFGLNNPTAWYLVGVDYDGNLLWHDSYYRPGLPSESAAVILARRAAGWERTEESGWGPRNDCWADPAIQHKTGGLTRWGEPATIKTEFEEAGVTLLLANNDPRAGYARLRYLLKPEPSRLFPKWHPRSGERGAPRMFVNRQLCPELVEQLKNAPLQAIDKRYGGEMVDPDWEGQHGHACFPAGTLVATADGPAPIEHVAVGTAVWTRAGLRRVAKAALSGRREVSTVRLDDGSVMTGTGDHPVWVEGRGWCPLAALRYGDKCLRLLQPSATRTSEPAGSGSAPTGRSRPATTFTTGTRTRSTTRLRIWSVCRRRRTYPPTVRAELPRARRTGAALPSGFARRKVAQRLAGTTAVPRTRSVSARSAASQWRYDPLSVLPAHTAAPPLRPRIPDGQSSARTCVGPLPVEPHALTTSRASALSADNHSTSIAMNHRAPALGHARVVSPPRPVEGSRSVAVYNLTVDGEHEYFANGVLVSNCAAARYGAMSRPDASEEAEPESDDLRAETFKRALAQEREDYEEALA